MINSLFQTKALNKDILIVGGGVVGVCAAYYLAKAGRQVALLEAGDICSGASYGNAGFILYSHITPLAAPGVLGQGLRWLIDSASPFYIKPRLSPELVSWLWRFRRACNETTMRRSMGLLSELSLMSKELFQDLTGLENLQFGYRKQGHLNLYNTAKGFDKGKQEADWVADFGVDSRILSPIDVTEKVSTASGDIIGGIHYPGDAHLMPDEFVRGLADLAVASGADIHTATEVLGFKTDGSKITHVTSTRGIFQADQVVLAGGAWSPAIVRDLELHLPIQAAKGYSVTYGCSEDPVPMPLLLKETAVAVTPMTGKIRFAGTLELAGLDFSVNLPRVDGLLGNIGGYLSDLGDLELLEIWRGLRPCTPDGLPVIGRTERYTNLILASGHAMVGMALGPATGKLVSQIADGMTPEVDTSPLSLNRFS